MPALLFIWIVAAGVAFAGLLFVTPSIPRGRELYVIAAVALILRLLPVILKPDAEGFWVTDIRNYETTASDVLNRRDIYLRPGFPHPYLPFQMYVFALSKLIADATPIPFFALVRLPQLAADTGIALLIARMGTRLWGSAEGTRSGLLYAVSPFPILATVYHGQFDSISVFLALAAACVLYEKRPADGGAPLRSAALLGLSILQKLWPAALLPVLLAGLDGHRERARYLVVAGLVVGGSVLAYLLAFESTPLRIRDSVFRYQSPFPYTGGPPLIIDRFLRSAPFAERLLRFEVNYGEWPAYAGTLAAAGWFIARRVPLFPAITGTLAVLFVLINDGAIYHYLWIVPFGLLSGQRLFVASIALAYAAAYVVMGFFGGAYFLPPIEGPGTRWLVDHGWWFFVWGWATFAAWSVVSIARAGRVGDEPEPVPQAAAASPS
jgi:hypothetical protein